jgi:hypothetical protein
MAKTIQASLPFRSEARVLPARAPHMNTKDELGEKKVLAKIWSMRSTSIDSPGGIQISKRFITFA